MNRTEKEQTVASLASGFSDATFVSLLAFKGLNVLQISSLRHELRAAGTEFRVVKNSLARRAIKGTDLEQLEELRRRLPGEPLDPVGAGFHVALDFILGLNATSIVKNIHCGCWIDAVNAESVLIIIDFTNQHAGFTIGR